MPILTRGIQNSTIEILRLNRIQCTFSVGAELRIEDVRFLKYTNLKEIYLSSNRIEQIENGAPFFFPQSLEKASVADNLFTFGLYIFEVISLQNLKWLNMSLQQMPHSPVEVVENILHFCVNKRRNIISDMEVYPSNETIKHAQEMFKAMSTYNFTIPVPPNLEIIYAREMMLRYVIPKLEFSQNTVKELYMQGNTFYRWAGPIIGNQIQTLAESTRNNISLLKEQTNISLNLLNNPLRCDCKTLDFLQWMVKERKLGKIRFPHFRDYACTKSSSDRKVLKFTNIDIQIEELIKQCSSYTTLFFIIASLIILFLAVLSAGLIYRVRWKLRYFYYMTKSRYHGYKAVRGDDQSNLKYDAFVSYAGEDRQFVLKMISKLEGEKNIRLCIHHRDFVPGYDIAENIITAVNKSKKTIIILSPNYIKSSWCMYELHIAKMEEIYSREKENVLFLVFYEAVPADKIPLKIMDVINQKSYTEFPNDEYGNTVFWNRLGEALM
uniref:Toll-like receptor 6 n=1 Tax=Crassostrea virginica TaxID=6565 RepID=A0A8B8BFD1_CRAVI|nr:toll-like receptor 6 [Crassostrea virginica]